MRMVSSTSTRNRRGAEGVTSSNFQLCLASGHSPCDSLLFLEMVSPSICMGRRLPAPAIPACGYQYFTLPSRTVPRTSLKVRALLQT
jgi:hypothetical protein